MVEALSSGLRLMDPKQAQVGESLQQELPTEELLRQFYKFKALQL